MHPVIEQIKGGLIVSVQAYPGEPLRNPETMALMARACELGGAAAIRCQGLSDISAIKGRVDIPVIGLWKEGHEGVYITPTLRHALAYEGVSVVISRRPCILLDKAFIKPALKIDKEKCRNCGMCMDACPYHAIVRLNVPCEAACPVRAIHKGNKGRAEIDFEKCTSCGRCMRACPFGAVMERSEVLPVLRALAGGRHVTALMAPAIVGQFSGGPARIVTALRRLGFADVMEVALGADVTSQREAAEFVERMERGDTFMTTSCCPAYVEAVRRHAPELLPHVSETATPMHYTAELARQRHPETVTVFIGPCVAKRQEGLHDEMVDYVLTFEEVGALFNARGIVVEECEEHELERPSNEARGYAIAGGVSAAVAKLVGDRFEVRPVAINGLSPQGLKKLQSFVKGGCPGNLVEVMTCVGGCVGGAGVVMPAAKCAKAVENFATRGKV